MSYHVRKVTFNVTKLKDCFPTKIRNDFEK